jgi:uncharacterized glyoxalase superfamily protein PhnB
MNSAPELKSITPIFQVTNLERAIDYYTHVLGFELGWTAGEPPDRASSCRDAVEIVVEVEPVPARGQTYLQVSGVDEYFSSITAAGARVKVPLGDRVYGMRDGRVIDPDGNEIHIGEPLVKD